MTVASAILLAACSRTPDTSDAERGVAQFRRQMDAHRFQEIYANAAPEFRQNASESTIMRFLNLVSTRLGRTLTATRQTWRVDATTNGSFVTLTYATTFDRGQGSEEFVFKMNGPDARLAGYHINSLDLMMDRLAPADNASADTANAAEPAPNVAVTAPATR